jgi:hypothetical protein
MIKDESVLIVRGGTMATVFDILAKYVKVVPEEGESGRDYTIRLAEAVAVFEPWKDLPDKAQVWYNGIINKVDKRDELLELDKTEEAEAVDIPVVEGFPVPERARRSEPTDGVGRVRRRGEPEAEPPAAPAAAPPPTNRGSIPHDARITLLTDTNPRRPGTKAEKLFKKYKTGITVGAMLKFGMSWRDIHADRARGAIKIDGIDDAPIVGLNEQARVVDDTAGVPREAPRYQEQAAASDILIPILEGLREFADNLLETFGQRNEDRS